ncbi:MAG TPA: N-acetylmuramoyl-L-alanine amidase [Cytophagaceae bacterium]
MKSTTVFLFLILAISSNIVFGQMPDSIGSILSQITQVPSTDPLIIQDDFVSNGFRKFEGKRKITAIILHSAYCLNYMDTFNLECILHEFKTYGVSAHYIIDRQGNIHRLVKENDVSFHAGKGTLPDGNTAPNSSSIGIEMVNSKTSKFSYLQYLAAIRLVKDIQKRHLIKYVLGHHDIAPSRKTDPWNFDWNFFRTMLKVYK